MSPRVDTKIWIGLLGLAFAGQIAGAENNQPVNWRIWNTTDGMVEAFVSQVTIAPAGKILIRHGDVASFEVLDGFKLSSVPDLRGLGRIQADAAGTLYNFDTKGLRVYTNGGWQLTPIPEIANFAHFGSYPFASWFDYPNAESPKGKLSVAVWNPGKVLISTDGELIERSLHGERRLLQTSQGTSIGSFLEVSPGRSGQFFVAALHGLASVDPRTNTWSEFPPFPAGFTRAAAPSYAANGDVLVTTTASDGRKSLLRIHKGSWTVLYSSHSMLRGWETTQGHVWILERNRLVELVGGRVTDFDLGPELTGRLRDVAVDGETFWLATMQGLARYAPSLWSKPENAPAFLRAPVSSISQGGDNTLWMWGGDYLIEKSVDTWKSYKLPRGETQIIGKTGSICPMRNGVVLLAVENTEHILELTPGTGKFRKLVHPEGKQIKWIEKRDQDTIWVQTLQPGESTSRLETYDGTRFSPVSGGEAIPTNDIRAILQTGAGVIWVGGTSALVRIVNGRLESFPKNSGLSEKSGFSLLEAPDHTVYLGQRDALLAYTGSRFRIVRRGLGCVRRLAISADGCIWAASGTGVHRYSGGEWITNTAEDGLPSAAAYTVFIDRTNHVWAGTTLGLGAYSPLADIDPPVTAIEDERNLREAPPDGEVRFTFSGIDKWKQTSSSRLLFSWRLDGKEWSPFEQTSLAAARNIPSGQHLFEVRAMDRNGNREARPAQFSFTVLYPWYRERGFFVFGGILILAILLLLKLAYRYHKDLCFQSRFDSVTRLANRRQFEEVLTGAVDRPGGRFAVIFIDLDGFKGVNDRLGHAAGDRVLMNLGTRLDKHLVKGDLLARIGGDEFAILLSSGTSGEAIGGLADRLEEVIRSCSPDPQSPISGSLGISLFPADGSTPSSLLRSADVAMYRAKSRGGDCHFFYEAWMKINRAIPRIAREQLSTHETTIVSVRRLSTPVSYT